MIKTMEPLAKFIKLKQINIFDIVFIVHSRGTMLILLTFALLLSAKQYFGDPIQCMTDLKFSDFVHSYCWTLGTFIVPTTMEDARKTVGVGVGPNAVEHITLRYYQWVAIVLFLEALLFYLPSYLWKVWEGKRLENLCSKLVPVILTEEELTTTCEMLVKYFNENNKIYHRSYFLKYYTCEALNIFISMFNMFFLDFFLDGFWSRYFKTLSRVSLSNWDVWNYHTSQVFPKLAKCTIYAFGLGGSINNNDALCMLPLNILNEKIFAFLWFWYILVSILAVAKILFDLLLIFCLTLRIQLLRVRANDISYRQLRSIIVRRSFGDWFILYKISSNISSSNFNELLRNIRNTDSHAKYTVFSDP